MEHFYFGCVNMMSTDHTVHDGCYQGGGKFRPLRSTCTDRIVLLFEYVFELRPQWFDFWTLGMLCLLIHLTPIQFETEYEKSLKMPKDLSEAIHRRTHNAIVKRKKGKRQAITCYKFYTENYRLNNTNLTNNRSYTQVLHSGRQCLLH